MSTDEAPGVRAHAIWLDVAHRLLTIDNGFGVPLCAIETTRVERRRFGRSAEGARVGIPFGDDAEIEYEQFRLLRVFQRAG
jgi:hypothetical protein